MNHRPFAIRRWGLPPALLALALLAACEAGPDYQPPAPTLAPFQAAAPAAGSRVALDHWWTAFGDAELTAIVTRVQAENLDLAASLERIAAARAGAAAAGARLLPSFDANTQVLAERQSLESPIGALGRAFPDFERNAALYDVGAGASWEIDLAGGLRRGEEAAKAEAEAAEAEQAGIRISASAEAADAYFQIRGFQARLRVAQEQVETDRQLLELIALRKDKSMATEREVAQAQALLAQARGVVPTLEAAWEAQMTRLAILMGRQPGSIGDELAQPAEIPDPPAASADPTDMLRRRPDIRAAERRLAAANARIGVAVADYYPKLSLSGLLGFESLDPTHLMRHDTFQPLVTGGLRWRLFDFGRIDAEVAQARAGEREALLRYRQSILKAAGDVEDAATDVAKLATRETEAENEVAALKRARDYSQEAYQRGLIALTDVLDADRQLLRAEDALPQSRADRARAAVRLYRALGGGW